MSDSHHIKNNIHYWVSHPNKKPTIVMIHGFTGSHDGFQYIAPLLKDFQIIIPDLPGFGISPLQPDGWTIADIARKTNDFVRSLGLSQPPFLVAHSMGGLVAASMLKQNPELFHKKATFISPVVKPINWWELRKIGELIARLQYWVGFKLPGVGPKIVKSKRLSRGATKLMITTPEPSLQADIYDHHINNLDYISSIELYYRLQKEITSMGTLQFVPDLKSFELLIINGDKDAITPLPQQKKLQKATGARLDVIKGVGHLAHYERPEEIAASLTRFLL